MTLPVPGAARAGAVGRHVRRWTRRVGRGAALLAVALGVLLLLLLVVALAEADDTEAGSGPLGAVEQLVRRNEWLHYQMHMSLGRVLWLVPRTRGVANEQFRKAAFHMPSEDRLRRGIVTRYPDAAPQVEALLACQAAVNARMRDFGFGVAFPPMERASRDALDRMVFGDGSGALYVVQPYALRATDARGGDANPDGVYTCTAQPTALRGWTVTEVEFTAAPAQITRPG